LPAAKTTVAVTSNATKARVDAFISRFMLSLLAVDFVAVDFALQALVRPSARRVWPGVLTH
jgi:hypothetical protein